MHSSWRPASMQMPVQTRKTQTSDQLQGLVGGVTPNDVMMCVQIFTESKATKRIVDHSHSAIITFFVFSPMIRPPTLQCYGALPLHVAPCARR